MDGQPLRHKLCKAAASVVSGFVAVKAEKNGLDVRTVREKAQQGFFSHAAQCKVALFLPFLFEQAEEREQVNGGFKDKQSFALAPVAEVKCFVAAFHIKPEVPGCAALVGVPWYAAFISADKYGVMVGGFLVNIPGGKEKARHIFINAAGCCEVVPRYAVVGAAGW